MASMDDVVPRYPFLAGGGDIGALIARHDWAATPLGPIEDWPIALCAMISFILRAEVPIVSLWGADGIMIYNDSYSAFAGGRHPGLLGSKVLEGWHEVADFNAHVMQKVFHEGGTLAFENQELTLWRNGKPEQVWTDLDYSPALDEQGRTIGVVAIVVETTERVKAQAWKDVERDRLNALFEQSPIFIAMTIGPEHRFEFANVQYHRLVGVRDLVGRTFAEALPKVLQEGGNTLLDTVYESGEPAARQEARYTSLPTATRSAKEYFVDYVCHPLRDPAGTVIGLFICGIDVTARVDTDRQMGETQALLRRAQAAGGIGLFTIAMDTNIITATPEFRRIFGLPADGQLSAADTERLVHPDDAGISSSAAARRAGTAALDVEYRIRRADTGETRLIARKAEFERDGAGNVLRLVGAVQDVTERRAMQRALA